jgi:alkaline phosphatase D
VNDVVVLTGDYHESFATELPFDRARYQLNGNSAAVEFIAPAITSPNLSEVLKMGGLPHALTINTVFEANNTVSNPWIKYHEGFSNGFGVAEFRADGMQFDFWFVADRTRPDTTARAAASWSVGRGTGVLAQAAAPLGPRPPTGLPAPLPQPQPTAVIPATGGSQNAALALGAAAVVGAAAMRAVRGEPEA